MKKKEKIMKIKLLTYYISLSFLFFLFSACDSSSSGSSGDSENNSGEVITITQEEEVKATINEAKKAVTQGAVINLICECGEGETKTTIRGQGDTESKARESAQKKCSLVEESSSISNCESPPST